MRDGRETDKDRKSGGSVPAAQHLDHVAASAPEMLAALEEIARQCRAFPIPPGLAFRCECIARTAIAQAKAPKQWIRGHISGRYDPYLDGL